MRIPRKLDHVKHALRLGQSGHQGLDDIHFVPNCIPDVSYHSVSLRTSLGDLSMRSPFVINAMTGGAQETEVINRDLAVAARECGIAMAVGSQMAALKHPDTARSYTVVRRMNPDGLVFANLGSEASPDQAEQAVEMLRADAMQIHVNVMQELIMPEGDRSFEGMLERIAAIAERLSIPVIVKEVGFGITAEPAAKLKEAGVRLIDVGGSGGTNFAAIENARREVSLGWLNEWGAMTSAALLDVAQHYSPSAIIASGGIRNAMDACKALAVGAAAVGMAGTLLRIWKQEGTAGLISCIEQLHNDLRLLMTALGATHISSLWSVPIIISGDTAHWCYARGVDIKRYANRSSDQAPVSR